MLFWMIAAALAAPPDHQHPNGRLEADVQAGLVDDLDALWISYLSHFEPDHVPERYADRDRGGYADGGQGWTCGTGVVQQLRERWHEFTDAERARMTGVLAPWKHDLLEPMVDVPPPPGPSSTCFSSQGANSYASEHFMVEWDTGITESQAIQFSKALEHSYKVEVTEQGWREPAGLSGYLMLVYVSNQNYGGAYTTIDYCGSMLMPYIVAGKGSFYGGSWFMDMASHEFNHASQFAYGFGHQFWFWEATATYVEESVYPSHNGWVPYVEGYTAFPQISMHASSQEDRDVFNHMYGLAVWNFYLDEHVGGPELIRDMWEYSVQNGEQYDLWMDDVLADLGYDFEDVYQGFIANNTVMDFAEQDAFPKIRALDEIQELPAEGAVNGSDAPQGRGQAYIRFDTDLANDEQPDLRITFEGADDAEFMALIVGILDGTVAEIEPLQVVDGVGKARLEQLADFDEAWLVVSPMTRSEESFDFSWTARAVAPVAPERAGLFACGCSAGPSGLAGWGASLLPLALLWRRRRQT